MDKNKLGFVIFTVLYVGGAYVGAPTGFLILMGVGFGYTLGRAID